MAIAFGKGAGRHSYSSLFHPRRHPTTWRTGHVDKKRETAVDLLAVNGIKWWTPHDLRRTITKVLDDAGIPGGASAILAHEIKQTDKLDGGMRIGRNSVLPGLHVWHTAARSTFT